MEKVNPVVSVKDLKVHIRDDENRGQKPRFTIDYGTFDINEGDFVLLKGRNGCGKSTFLRLFRLQSVGYFDVEGSIRFLEEGFPEKSIDEYTTAEQTRLNRRVSFIGQEEVFQSADSAYSYIYNACRYAMEADVSFDQTEKRVRLQRVDEAIAEYYKKFLAASFQCKDYKTFKNKGVRKWSGGQQKMINVLAGIIKAQICGVKLMVMDEPLNNLDGRNKDILNSLIKELRKTPLAIAAVTHCQIFDGVNKVLMLTEDEKDPSLRHAEMIEGGDKPHSECLEPFRG